MKAGGVKAASVLSLQVTLVALLVSTMQRFPSNITIFPDGSSPNLSPRMVKMLPILVPVCGVTLRTTGVRHGEYSKLRTEGSRGISPPGQPSLSSACLLPR